MSAETHNDPSKGWLILFFVCFVVTIVGIGVYNAFTYNANEPEPVAAAGHH